MEPLPFRVGRPRSTVAGEANGAGPDEGLGAFHERPCAQMANGERAQMAEEERAQMAEDSC